MPAKKLISLRISGLTAQQIADLQKVTGMNQTELVSVAIDRMAREEKKMTRDDIDKLFGSEATDENLRYMGKNWSEWDVNDYLIQTGYNADCKQVIIWLRNFANS